jgi:hypothetical protein
VLLRADGFWAYQLAVVVDDAEQGMSDIVRGADLLVSTPRQIHVQRCLGLPTPDYCHLPLLVNAAGEKLSKQTLAPAINPGQVVQELRQALCRLGQCRRPNARLPPSCGNGRWPTGVWHACLPVPVRSEFLPCFPAACPARAGHCLFYCPIR